MQLFTNANKTRFFATNDHVIGLQPIEINNIKDLMETMPDIDINLLISNFFFEADEFGELIIQADDGYHPVTPFVFDFLDSMTFSEIAAKAISLYEYGDTARLILQIKALWSYTSILNEDEGVEEFLFVATDNSKLLLTLSHFAHKVDAQTYRFNEDVVTKLLDMS